MKLYFHRRYRKQYQKLTHVMQIKANIAVKKFVSNPKTPGLKNHALKGEFQGQRAISVTGDVRIIFEEEDNYKRVTLLRIGTHNQVY